MKEKVKKKIDPYDSLVNFINRHSISSDEEIRLRKIIKEIQCLKSESEEQAGENKREKN